MTSPFKDPRALGLLSRVRDDVSLLRRDVSKLLTHTTRYTLPQGARGLADSARHQLVAGSHYAASRFRSLGSSPPKRALGVLGGAIFLGIIAAGLHAICQSQCNSRRDEVEDDFDSADR